MYVRYLSWRYLMRRRINIIGVMGITVGVGALIMILSIMSGFLEESRNTVRGSLSDVIIEPSGAPRMDGSRLPKQVEPLLNAVLADERVEAASPHLSWAGLLIQSGWGAKDSVERLKDAQGSDLAFAHFVGIDVEAEFATTELRAALEDPTEKWGVPVDDVEHPFARPKGYDGDAPWAWVVVGEQLAGYHGLYQGSLINLVTVVPDPYTGEAEQCNRKFLVAGTFRSGENEVDLTRIYVAREELADFIGDTHEFTQLLVKLKDYEAERGTIAESLGDSLVKQGLLARRGSLEVRTWESFRGSLLGAIENERVLMGIMLGLIVLVAAFTVFAILMMMVTEKRRDIGILTALGATPRSIMAIFLMIGMWNALLGCLIGATVGIIGALKIDALEQFLSATFGVQIFNREVYIFDHIPSVVSPVAVASIVGGALIATAVFSLVPAWSASRLHPIDALRAE
ncbi:MAG: lipoprotein-releasing system permease protein [Candidatus Paceibacteria bacterium]|jgi:lipoprotein-releasing system permease protein